MSAKTIQIFLADGDPSGIRIAELTTRIVQAISIPKTMLDQFFKRPEADNIATYFLFGGDDSDSKPIAYIGQTEDLKSRLKSHDVKKDFWTTAVVVISRTHSFTQAHIKWLEWHSIAQATEANRYRLDNGNAGSEPFATEPMKADLQEIFETGSLLLESLGFPIFKPLVERSQLGEPEEEKELWYLEGPDAKATALFTTEGFVVLKGSLIRRNLPPAMKATNLPQKHQSLLNAHIFEINGNSFLLKEDYPFSSPSTAATTILGRSSNGWSRWKDKDGRTLDEVKRRD